MGHASCEPVQHSPNGAGQGPAVTIVQVPSLPLSAALSAALSLAASACTVAPVVQAKSATVETATSERKPVMENMIHPYYWVIWVRDHHYQSVDVPVSPKNVHTELSTFHG